MLEGSRKQYYPDLCVRFKHLRPSRSIEPPLDGADTDITMKKAALLFSVRPSGIQLSSKDLVEWIFSQVFTKNRSTNQIIRERCDAGMLLTVLHLQNRC